MYTLYICVVCKYGTWSHTYLPLRLGVKPKNAQIPTDMTREAMTVATALRAKPHLDFTISILPVKENIKIYELNQREHWAFYQSFVANIR